MHKELSSYGEGIDTFWRGFIVEGDRSCMKIATEYRSWRKRSLKMMTKEGNSRANRINGVWHHITFLGMFGYSQIDLIRL